MKGQTHTLYLPLQNSHGNASSAKVQTKKELVRWRRLLCFELWPPHQGMSCYKTLLSGPVHLLNGSNKVPQQKRERTWIVASKPCFNNRCSDANTEIIWELDSFYSCNSNHWLANESLSHRAAAEFQVYILNKLLGPHR